MRVLKRKRKLFDDDGPPLKRRYVGPAIAREPAHGPQDHRTAKRTPQVVDTAPQTSKKAVSTTADTNRSHHASTNSLFDWFPPYKRIRLRRPTSIEQAEKGALHLQTRRAEVIEEIETEPAHRGFGKMKSQLCPSMLLNKNLRGYEESRKFWDAELADEEDFSDDDSCSGSETSSSDGNAGDSKEASLSMMSISSSPLARVMNASNESVAEASVPATISDAQLAREQLVTTDASAEEPVPTTTSDDQAANEHLDTTDAFTDSTDWQSYSDSPPIDNSSDISGTDNSSDISDIDVVEPTYPPLIAALLAGGGLSDSNHPSTPRPSVY